MWLLHSKKQDFWKNEAGWGGKDFFLLVLVYPVEI